MNTKRIKANLYLTLILLFPLTVAGQAYVPFISTTDSSDTWKDVFSCTDFSCYTTYLKRFTLDGDTTIGPYQYAKIRVFEKFQEGADLGQFCNESIFYSDYYFGALREDSKQVFLKRPTSPEYLAYDFNLAVGDTVPSPVDSTGNANLRVINLIDSVMVNGNFRKRFWVNSGADIVEGMGASHGLFHSFYNPWGGQCDIRMLCYKENDTPYYFIDDCNVILGQEDAIQPTPAPKLVKVIDYMGREVEELPNTLLIYIYSDGSSRKVFRLR